VNEDERAIVASRSRGFSVHSQYCEVRFVSTLFQLPVRTDFPSSAITPIRVITSGDVDFVVYPNAIEVVPYSDVNGVRTPIPDYQYKMTFEHAGTAGYGNEVFIFEPGNMFTLFVLSILSYSCISSVTRH
jgi:hypothetical protein